MESSRPMARSPAWPNTFKACYTAKHWPLPCCHCRQCGSLLLWPQRPTAAAALCRLQRGGAAQRAAAVSRTRAELRRGRRGQQAVRRPHAVLLQVRLVLAGHRPLQVLQSFHSSLGTRALVAAIVPFLCKMRGLNGACLRHGQQRGMEAHALIMHIRMRAAAVRTCVWAAPACRPRPPAAALPPPAPAATGRWVTGVAPTLTSAAPSMATAGTMLRTAARGCASVGRAIPSGGGGVRERVPVLHFLLSFLAFDPWLQLLSLCMRVSANACSADPARRQSNRLIVALSCS